MVNEKPTLAIIIPCYNEEEVLSETAKRLLLKISDLISAETISGKSVVLFIDDGSGDSTWTLIEKFHNENPLLFNGIKLSKNKGQQVAYLCGLITVKDYADITITIDADLQIDIDTIDQMLEKHFSGAEIVFGVHSGRNTDRLIKKTPSRLFYLIMRFLGVNIVHEHSHFRLMGKKAVNAVSEYKEVNLFMPGIVSQLGYKTSIVYFNVKKRFAGKSKYRLHSLIDLALDAVTSFSVKPIRFIIFLGVLIFTAGLIFTFRAFSGHEVNQLASLFCSLWIIGGIIVFSIGIVGEYIGKMYAEIKQRPRYHIDQTLLRQEITDGI